MQPAGDQHTADQYHDHIRRIERISALWMRGEITPAKKRELIAAENADYYRGEHRSSVTGELLTKAPRAANYQPQF